MKKVILTICLGLMLTACSSVKLNPFGDSAKGNQSGYQQYECTDKKQFGLKMVNQQQNAWLQLVDHEVYLTRSETDANQYSNGEYQVNLEVEATLTNVKGQQSEGCVLVGEASE